MSGNDYGPIQAPRELGLAVWQFEAARRRGLIAAPGPAGRWSAEAIAAARARLPEILAAVGERPPAGAGRCAEQLAERLGLEVSGPEVEQLAERGLLTAVGAYKGFPLYDRMAVDEVGDQHLDLLRELVADRLAWLDSSVHPAEAQRRLGWSREEFGCVVAERGISRGRFGRYAVADIDALAGDEELGERVRGARLLGADQAAVHLEVRRTDFDYAVAARWVRVAGYTDVQVGRRWAKVPLYRTADVEALLDLPGVDWEAVRAARPGDASPLREYAALPTPRWLLVRGFAADLSARYGVTVQAVYDGFEDQWELRWTPGAAGLPTAKGVRAALRADRVLAPHAGQVTVRLLHPGE